MAGYIVPNIDWNQTTFNLKGSAIPWQQRKNISLALESESEDDTLNDDKTKTSTTNVGAILAPTEKLGVEILTGQTRTDYEDDDDESTGSLIGQAGYLITPNFALGTELYFLDYEYGTERSYANLIGLSGTYSLGNNMYAGGGLRKIHFVGNDLEVKTVHAGFGFYEENHMSAEAVIEITPADEKGNSSISQNTKLIADGTYNYNNIQFKANLTLDKYVDDTDSFDEETLDTTITISGEYKFSEHFFAGLTLSKFNQKFTDNDDSSNDSDQDGKKAGLFVRYKENNFQALLKMNSGDLEEDTDGTTTVEEESQTFSAQFSYFF